MDGDLPEALGSIPITYMTTYNCVTAVSGNLITSSYLYRYQVYMVQTDMKAECPYT